jgi:hypothetical protein
MVIGECPSESRQLPVGFQSTEPGLCLMPVAVHRNAIEAWRQRFTLRPPADRALHVLDSIPAGMRAVAI